MNVYAFSHILEELYALRGTKVQKIMQSCEGVISIIFFSAERCDLNTYLIRFHLLSIINNIFARQKKQS